MTEQTTSDLQALLTRAGERASRVLADVINSPAWRQGFPFAKSDHGSAPADKASGGATTLDQILDEKPFLVGLLGAIEALRSGEQGVVKPLLAAAGHSSGAILAFTGQATVSWCNAAVKAVAESAAQRAANNAAATTVAEGAEAGEAAPDSSAPDAGQPTSH
jgi:hypothetical protein